MVKDKKSFADYIGLLLIMITYFLSYIIVNNSNELVIFMGMTAMIGAVAVFKTRFKIEIWKSTYYIYILAFAAFCYLSSAWAIQPRICIGKGNTIIEILLLMFVICMFIKKQKDPIDLLLQIIMWGGLLIVVYSISFYGLSGLKKVFESEGRLDNSLININNIGMSAAYSILICVYYVIYDKPRLWNICILPCVIMLAASGSRKAIVIVIIGAVMLFVMKNMNNKNALKSMFKTTIVLLLLTIAFLVLLQLPIFADIKRRMLSMFAALTGNKIEADNSALTRLQLISIGWRIFSNNKLKGIGIDNARLVVKSILGKDNYYLHNNYIELLADGGILGFGLYYSIYVALFIKFLLKRNFMDKEFNICFALLMVNLVIEYGAVTYIYKHTYIFLMLFMLESEKLRRKHKPLLSNVWKSIGMKDYSVIGKKLN